MLQASCYNRASLTACYTSYPYLALLEAKFIQRVTIRIREKEKLIKGLWCTEEKMRVELKYSKQLV